MLKLLLGDITKIEADAVVNAANRALSGGGGVDGAIHRAAGKRLDDACKSLGGCSVGEAKITPAFDMDAKYVIHTVGPVYKGGNHGEEASLRACYASSLALAYENGAKSVAFPSISTGAYRYPVADACAVAVDECAKFLSTHSDLDVLLVAYDQKTYGIMLIEAEKRNLV